MSTYIIGDVHGCFKTLKGLLEQLEFEAGRDQLWLVGDLVNRGCHSLKVLRWCVKHSKCLRVVLGNHDLQLLYYWKSGTRPEEGNPLHKVLAAPDREELLEWLIRQPLMHSQNGNVMVHAGLPPQWSLEQAFSKSQSAARVLQGDEGQALLELYSHENLTLCAGLSWLERHCCTLQMMTRIRTCTPEGARCKEFNGPPRESPPGCEPWFERRRHRWTQEGVEELYFGHWAALGFFRGPGVICLDSGCAHGGPMTALRLEDKVVIQQENAEEPG